VKFANAAFGVLRIRALCFNERAGCTPTDTQMDLPEGGFDIAMRVRELLPRHPGRWETVCYSIQNLCQRLVRFVDTGKFDV